MCVCSCVRDARMLFGLKHALKFTATLKASVENSHWRRIKITETLAKLQSRLTDLSVL